MENETVTNVKPLGMCDRLIVVTPFKAGKATCKVDDRLQVFTGIDVIEPHGRCATAQNTRTRTVITMPVSSYLKYCKRIGFDGLEDFS